MHYILSVSIYFVRYFIHNALSLEKSYMSFLIMCDLCKLILYFIWMDIFWIECPMIKHSNWVYYIFHWKNHLMPYGEFFFFSSFGFTFFIRRSRIIMDIVCRCRSSLSVEKNCGKHRLVPSDGFRFIFVSRFTTIKILIYDQVSS